MGVDCLWFSFKEMQMQVSLAWLGLISPHGVLLTSVILGLWFAKLIALIDKNQVPVAKGNVEKLTLE